MDVEQVFHRTVVAGALIAGLAGLMAGLYFGNISFGTGLIYGLKILFVTAAGGYHAPARAAGGAAVFGIAESLWTGYFPVEWREAAVFLALVACSCCSRPTSSSARFPERRPSLPDRLGCGRLTALAAADICLLSDL